MIYQALPLWTLMTSLVAALVVFAAGESRHRLRITVNLAAAVFKLVLVGVMLLGVLRGDLFLVSFTILPGLDLVFHADALTLLFTTLSAVLWLVTTVYAVSYLEQRPNRARFFGFFSLCVAATMGIATAGNLFTFFVFYELLTLATWPLVVHNGWPKAMAVGRLYLRYTLGGGAVLLLGIVALNALGVPGDFLAGGSLDGLEKTHPGLVYGIFLLLLLGLGVKAAVVPLHVWLPNAMVAPAPVSALLHAVAVVKAGAFGIIRVVHDVYGIDLADSLGVLTPLLIVASVTIVYGSLHRSVLSARVLHCSAGSGYDRPTARRSSVRDTFDGASMVSPIRRPALLEADDRRYSSGNDSSVEYTGPASVSVLSVSRTSSTVISPTVGSRSRTSSWT